jgi:protein phosphatase 2C family protein 2/3
MARIFRAGGYVEYGRVNGRIGSRAVFERLLMILSLLGNLALARALGDFEYKKNANVSAEDQIITANPEIMEHKITEDDEFLIIACDGLSPARRSLYRLWLTHTGIWDCLTSQQCVDVVRLLISREGSSGNCGDRLRTLPGTRHRVRSWYRMRQHDDAGYCPFEWQD